MAKRAELGDREEKDTVIKKTGKKRTSKVDGVYLSDEERARVDAVKRKWSTSRGQVLKFAVLYFLKHFEAGDVDVEFEQVKRPKLPD